MGNFFKRHNDRLKNMALILMLVIPFLLYAAASFGSLFQVKLFLVLMGANMLYVMLKA